MHRLVQPKILNSQKKGGQFSYTLTDMIHDDDKLNNDSSSI